MALMAAGIAATANAPILYPPYSKPPVVAPPTGKVGDGPGITDCEIAGGRYLTS